MKDSENSAYQSKIVDAIAYSQKLLDASIAVVGSVDGVVDKTARQPEIVVLTILCRSISNFHAALMLVQNQGVVEARALVRLMYENVLWIGALQERGSEFVKDMLDDEAHNRKMLSQLAFSLAAKQGGNSEDEEALQLRTLVREMDKEFPSKRKLNAAKVAASGPIENAYFEYGRYSLDAVHCSVTALGRHLSRQTIGDRSELHVSVVPNTPSWEVLATIVSACRALIYAVVGLNSLLDIGKYYERFSVVLSEFEAAVWSAS